VEVEAWYNPLTCEAAFGSTPDEPPHGWWRGRSDIIGRTPQGSLHVLDHKTGSPRHQTPPWKSDQLFFFAAWLASHPETAGEAARGVHLSVYKTQSGDVEGYLAQPAEIAEQQAKMAALEAKLSIVEQGGPEAERVMAENPPAKNKDCFFCTCKPL